MCGRFTLTVDPARLREALNLGEMPVDLEPRYNIAPSQPVPVVTDPVDRRVELFQWGLVPSWAKDPHIGNRMINARAETLREKPAYRNAFAHRRCLVLADGFFEWERREQSGRAIKHPYYIRLASGEPFAFAGLWETWRPSEDGDGTLLSCTIITCPANERIASLHDRMPVILNRHSLWEWLDPQASLNELTGLLKPYAAEQMALYPVRPLVNRPENDIPAVIEPAGPALSA